MGISEELKKAVREDNRTRVKIMLKNKLLIDVGGREFQESLEYVKHEIPSFMDIHDGEVLKTSKQWTEDYMNSQLVKLINNFSIERVNLLIQVVQALGKEKNTNNVHSTSEKNKKRGRSTVRRPARKKETGIAICALGAVVVGTGLVLKTTVTVPLVGGVAMIAGAAMFLSDDDQ